MEVKDFICTAFEHINHVTGRVLNGLSHSETLWRPGPGCNSIALILFHSARFEDMVVQTRILERAQIWETEKWYQKLNLPASENAAGYAAEQVAAFSVPDFKDLKAYSDTVRAQTIACIKSIPVEKLDKVINMPFLGEIKISSLLALIMVHQSEHIGEISYVRGLQRGMNK